MRISAQQLERQIEELIAEAAQILPGEAFDEARRYLDHNEFGLALDTVAATLAAFEKRVGPDLYEKFLLLGNQMQMEQTFWAKIQPQD